MKRLFIVLLLSISSSAYSAEKFVVHDIHFTGLQRFTIGAITHKMSIHIGDRINHEDISKNIRSLYSIEGFEDICVLRDKGTLIFQFKELPVIESICFSGNTLIKDSLLKKNMNEIGFRIGEFFHPSSLFYLEKDLKNYYQSIGHFNANIQTTITQSSYNRVIIKLFFQEGKTGKIKKISIIGNKAFKKNKLISLFQLQEQNKWWNKLFSPQYQQKKLMDDMQILQDYYLDNGYICFNINSANISLTPDKHYIYISINIEEGDKYKISEVKTKSNCTNLCFNIESLVKNKIKIGEVYKNSKIKKIEDDIKKILEKHGYICPDIQTRLEINSKSKTVRLLLNVDQGNQFYVRRIYFEGNDISKDIILRREIRQMEATWLDYQLVKQGKERLNRLGYFESVDVETRKVDNYLNQVDIIYKVKERNTGNFNFGIGYGTESNVSLQIGMQQDNWLGNGYSFGINGTKNNYRTCLEMSINNPYFTIDGLSLEKRIFYNNFKANNADLSTYINKSYGFDSNIGIPINKNFFIIGLSYVHNSLSNMQPQVAMWRYVNSIGQNNNNTNQNGFIVNDLTFNYGYNYNKLNYSIFPTQGIRANINAKITIPGSDNNFYKLSCDVFSYLPIDQYHKWIISNHIQLGYGNGFCHKELPFYENFYAGGFNTVRGFRSNNIGPKAVYYKKNYQDNYDLVFLKRNSYSLIHSDDAVGGNAMTILSLELITPTFFIKDRYAKTVRTSFFIDAGTVWDTKWNDDYYPHIMNYSVPSNVRTSIGIAFRWMSPLGPLVFSYAKPIKKYERDKIEQFQFNFGKIW